MRIINSRPLLVSMLKKSAAPWSADKVRVLRIVLSPVSGLLLAFKRVQRQGCTTSCKNNNNFEVSKPRSLLGAPVAWINIRGMGRCESSSSSSHYDDRFRTLTGDLSIATEIIELSHEARDGFEGITWGKAIGSQIMGLGAAFPHVPHQHGSRGREDCLIGAATAVQAQEVTLTVAVWCGSPLPSVEYSRRRERRHSSKSTGRARSAGVF
jgi:hypothetical protein